jgi:hypothetical protein
LAYITCLTVAAAVLTTLSELRDVPSSRKQMPSTAPMLSCRADEKHTFFRHLSNVFQWHFPPKHHHTISLYPHLKMRMHRRLQQCESGLQHLQLHTLVM